MGRGIISAHRGVFVNWLLNCGFLRVDALFSSSYSLSMDTLAPSTHARHQRGHAINIQAANMTLEGGCQQSAVSALQRRISDARAKIAISILEK